MYSKVNYTIVGIFVLAFGAGLVWFAFWLAKYGIHREFDIYKLNMTESVAGLSKDSVVKLHGVDIGRVSEIRIDPKNIEHIEIFLKINKGVPIKEDMVAHTQMLGVTGLLSIEIDGGTNEAKTLQPTEDHIPVIPTAPSWFTKTTRGLGTLSDRITLLVDKTQKLMSEKNIETLGKVFDNTEIITAKAEDVEKKAMTSLEEVDKTLQEFRVSMKNINKKLTQAGNDFKTMQKDFSSIKKVTIPTINKLMQTTKNFNRVTLKVEKSLDRGDYDIKKIFEPLLVDIGIVSEQINDLARELKESPNDILFKSREQRRGPGE
ncbi:MlaD family protein [Sulfurovum sp.]|uniref:MlaD family protein n=1 Tax=Sulfurovum sp. TaxID=1969726 RepID=UPI0025D4294D|nr:MlaD family protein [Sulfurovum sp.]